MIIPLRISTMPSSKVKTAITAGVITVLVVAAVSIFDGVLKSTTNTMVARQGPVIGHRNLSLNLDGDGNKRNGVKGMPRETRTLRSRTKPSFFDPKTVEQKPVVDAAGSFAFDPNTIHDKPFEDVSPSNTVHTCSLPTSADGDRAEVAQSFSISKTG